MNKLIGKTSVEMYRQHGSYDPLRCTGRTTAIALELLAKCIREPNTDHAARDHHGTHQADVMLAKHVVELAERMGLLFFRHNHIYTGTPTVRCDLYTRK